MKPTNGELNIMFENLMKELKNFSSELKDNTKLTRDILVQFTHINNRVDIVEPLAFDYQINRERIKGAVIFGSVIATAVIAMFMLMGKFYIDAKEKTITENVSQAVYDKLIKEFQVTINN